MDPTTTLQTMKTWPLEDRLDFALRLWDQLIDDGWQPEPDASLAAEIARRLDAHETNPTDVRTWEQIQERLRSQR